MYLWGNASTVDLECRQAEREVEGMTYKPRKFQGHIEKIAASSNAYIALLDDGTVTPACRRKHL